MPIDEEEAKELLYQMWIEVHEKSLDPSLSPAQAHFHMGVAAGIERAIESCGPESAKLSCKEIWKSRRQRIRGITGIT